MDERMEYSNEALEEILSKGISEEALFRAESLGNYDVFLEEGLSAIRVPKGLRGEAQDPLFYYDGGNHGILQKNETCFVILDYLHFDVRGELYQEEEIFILEEVPEEEDMGRDYMAKVVICQGISHLADRIMKYETFPNETNQEAMPEWQRIEGIQKEIDNLIGMAPFKAYMKELKESVGFLSQFKGKTNFPTEHLLFAIDKGCGLSEVLILFEKFLNGMNLYQSHLQINYQKITYQLEVLTDPEKEFWDALEDLQGLEGYIIVMDLEEWIGKLNSQHFDMLLQACEKSRHRNIFVFTVPFLEQQELIRLRRGLNDRLNVKLVEFPPYRKEEYLLSAKKQMEKMGFHWEEGATSLFYKLLWAESKENRFYGFKTVKKICEKVIREKLIAGKKEQGSSRDSVQKRDMQRLLEDFPEKTGQEELEALVGLESVKKRILEIVLSLKAQKQLAERGQMKEKSCYHMMFTGNPGTGKTEVARLVGKIFQENDLLSEGELIEISRFNLVGEYIGQTGPKTINVCRQAHGSVLFLDEAYLLTGGSIGGNDRDFGTEAVGALVAEMENYRDKFVMIFAGYKEDMEDLCKLNSGIRERIPHRIHFDNYSRQELYEIFVKMLHKQIPSGDFLLERAKEYFEKLPDSVLEDREFSNARFVRNIVERVISRSLIRIQETGGDFRAEGMDFEYAIGDSDLIGKNPFKNRNGQIGFQRQGERGEI